MKHEYKIDTGLWYYQCETSKDREKFMFDSDEEAWNKLRLVIPNAVLINLTLLRTIVRRNRQTLLTS